MGGGTGSGVGTRIIDILRNEYPDVYRYTPCVYDQYCILVGPDLLL